LILDRESPPHGAYFSLFLSGLIRKIPFSDHRRVLPHPVGVTGTIRRVTFADEVNPIPHALKAEFPYDLDGWSAPSHSERMKRAGIEGRVSAVTIAAFYFPENTATTAHTKSPDSTARCHFLGVLLEQFHSLIAATHHCHLLQPLVKKFCVHVHTSYGFLFAYQKITVILYERQILFLDKVSLAIRERTGQVVHRAELIRAVLDKAAGSLNPESNGFDLTIRELFPILKE
jgi:hypothetical protein